MSIRVGILVKPIEDGKSGSGSHLHHLVEHMLKSSLVGDFDLVFLHYNKKVRSELLKQGRCQRISRNPLLASMQIQRERFDLIHYSPLTIFSPIFVSAKKVATIHGDMQNFLSSLYKPHDVLHKKFVVRKYARVMDHIFTVSKTSEAYLLDEYRLSRERVSITYNAVTSDFKKLEVQEISDFLASKRLEKPYLFHLSRFSERKNPWTLLEAFAKVAMQQDYIELLVGGYGWDNAEVRTFLKEKRLETKVKLLGFLSNQDIVRYLNGARMFIFPSLYEGYGMPNLEAMSCGCPVITTKVFAIPEVVGSGAILLDEPKNPDLLKDAILRLLSDDLLNEQLVNSGLANVQRFNWQFSADHVLKTYKMLVEE